MLQVTEGVRERAAAETGLGSGGGRMRLEPRAARHRLCDLGRRMRSYHRTKTEGTRGRQPLLSLARTAGATPAGIALVTVIKPRPDSQCGPSVHGEGFSLPW